MNKIDVKAIRKSLDVTQIELGRMIGVSKNTISNYENGGVIPESKRELLLKLQGRNWGEERILAAITGDKNLINTGTVGGSIVTSSSITNSTIDFSTEEGIQLLKDRVIELEAENKRLLRDKANLEKLVNLMEGINKQE